MEQPCSVCIRSERVEAGGAKGAYDLDACGRLGRRDEQAWQALRYISRSLVSAPAVKVQVHEDTPTTLHVVLPVNSQEGKPRDLSDAELEHVAAGWPDFALLLERWRMEQSLLLWDSGFHSSWAIFECVHVVGMCGA